jgi:hypothetical protein
VAQLAPGHIDTGTSATHTLSFDISVRAQVPSGDILADFPNTLTVVRLYTEAVTALHGRSDLGAGIDTADTIRLALEYGPGPTIVILETLGSIPNSGEPPLFADVTVSRTDAGLRLGVTIDGNDHLRYEWWQDSSTTATITVGGNTVEAWTKSEPPVSLGGGGRLMWYTLIDAAATATYYRARFKDFTFGAGSLPFGPYEFFEEGTIRNFGAPWAYTVDARVIDADGTTVAGVDLLHQGSPQTSGTWTLSAQQDNEHTGPLPPDGIALVTHRVEPASLEDPWLSAQTVRPYPTDLECRFAGNAPKSPGDASPTDYSVGTLTIAPSVSILQSSEAWVIDSGSGSVGGTSTVPVFTITSGPATVRRPLKESWTDWNDSGSPDFEPTDNWTTTDSDFYASGAGDDRWGVGLYALMDLDLTVPAGPNTQVAVAITYAVAQAEDTIEVTYSTDVAGNPITFPAGGRSTQRIDLMFPVEIDSRPLYGERIAEVRIIGLLAGVTTVHELAVVADEQAYITLSGRRDVLADDTIAYSGIVIAQDGQAPSLLWGTDTPLIPAADRDLDGRTDQHGDHQNGVFTLDGVTTAFLGEAPGMAQATLSDTFTELSRMEGLTSVYSSAALDAALSDAFGEIGIDGAGAASPVVRASTWFKPIRPADRMTAGAAYTVLARVVVTDVLVPAGRTSGQVVVFQRNYLGMLLEGLATDAAYNRHGAAVTVTARGYTGGAPAPGDTVLGSDTTDASGFALVPIRTGTLSGSQFSAYLS